MILLYPWVLLGFPFYLLCERYCRAVATKRYFPNVAMLKNAAGKSADIKKFLRYAILLLMFLALAAPVQKHQSTQSHGRGHDISLLLDASDSMHEAKRFEVAKSIIAYFVSSRQGDRLALSLFADYAYLCVPLTTHTKALNTVLGHLQIGVAGKRHTALYEALYQGASIFEDSTAKHKIIILLTDGLNTVKSVPLQSALARVKKEHLKVYTIGIGDDYRKGILERIARESGGKFYEASNPQTLRSIYHEINRLEQSEYRTETLTYHIPLFRYPLALALILLLPYLFLLHRQRTLRLTHVGILLLTLFALYGPHHSKGTLQQQKNTRSLIEALDLSYSMDVQDSYPSREAIALNRATALLDAFPSAKIGLIAFAKQGYLITPPTQDHNGLKQLLKGLDASHIHREGSHILAALQSAVMFLPPQQNKTVVLFTDGGTQQDFSQEIAYAKKMKLQVYIYAIGTRKGGVIKNKNTLRKDHSGNIIISRRNPAAAALAEESGGKYLVHKASGASLDALVSAIQSTDSAAKNSPRMQQQRKEFYFLPLLLALLLLISTHLGLRRRR